MSLPLAERADSLQGLLLALAIGILFGFLLERGGLGDARKLAAQFYLRDLTVLKVLFTAVLTALFGVLWLARFGLLDAAALRVPISYLQPQLMAGLIFGAGFVMAGLCPGTACVSAATGKLDGLATIFGLLAGVTLFAGLFDGLAAFAYSGSLGRAQLSSLLGLSDGLAAALLAVIALLVFAGAERLETRRRPTLRPRLLVVPLLGALLLTAGFVGSPLTTYRPPAMFPASEAAGETLRLVHPWQLADWLVTRGVTPRLVDLRAKGETSAYRIPGSEDLAPGALPGDDPVVLIAAGDEIPRQAYRRWEAALPGRIYLLEGGVEVWLTEVLFPDLARLRAAPPETLDRLRRHSRYFGGAPRNEDPARLRRGYGREGC